MSKEGVLAVVQEWSQAGQERGNKIVGYFLGWGRFLLRIN